MLNDHHLLPFVLSVDPRNGPWNLSLYLLNYSRKLGDMLSYGPHIKALHFREYTAPLIHSSLLRMVIISERFPSLTVDDGNKCKTNVPSSPKTH